MTQKKFVSAAALAASLALGNPIAIAAPVIDLNGLGFVQYGDGLSYSLPIGGISFPSTPGQISGEIVLATGASGNPVVTNFSGMDNAYETPSGVGGETFFYANPVTSNGTQGTVANNGDNTWDSSLSALKTFLGDDQLVIMFNNNQINADGRASQSLAAWARLWLTDGSGAVVGGSTFEFTNNDGRFALVSEGGGGTFLGDPTTYLAAGSGPGEPDAGTFASTDFVLAGGAICVINTGPIPIPVTCGVDPDGAGPLTVADVSAPINHNLGADNVAYAVVFPELNAILDGLFGNAALNLDDFTLHADIRLGCEALDVVSRQQGQNTVFDYGTNRLANWMDCGIAPDGWNNALNNGFEQIFIVRGAQPGGGQVPEPGALFLVGAGLLALFARRSDRKA